MLLFFSLVVGFIIGYFIIRHDHPDFSITLSVLICAAGLSLATAIIAWQIYRTPKT
jgi:ribose/xylose/arabinose/galactoside ABC-type transport system permease subunit